MGSSGRGDKPGTQTAAVRRHFLGSEPRQRRGLCIAPRHDRCCESDKLPCQVHGFGVGQPSPDQQPLALSAASAKKVDRLFGESVGLFDPGSRHPEVFRGCFEQVLRDVLRGLRPREANRTILFDSDHLHRINTQSFTQPGTEPVQRLRDGSREPKL